MEIQSTPTPLRTGLALSGGGYRASAYHLGTLRKLEELGVLSRVDVLSTISGGSITGAAWCLHEGDYASFESMMIEKISSKNVIRYALLSFMALKTLLFFLVFLAAAVYCFFTPWPWASYLFVGCMLWLFLRFQFSLFPVSEEIQKAYDAFFYGGKCLNDLREDKPRIVIGSTNLQTARPFSFSKTFMGDSAYTYRKPPVLFSPGDCSVSLAVMASSCVPFAFTPVPIGPDYFLDPSQYGEVMPQLVDGGVYDNQGIHKIMQEGVNATDIVITSDAGNKLSSNGITRNVLQLAIRSMDLFMARIKNAQLVSDLYDNTDLGNKQVAYISLGWDLANCIPGFITNLAAHHVPSSVIADLGLPAEWASDPNAHAAVLKKWLEDLTGYAKIPWLTDAELRTARSVSTNLTPLSRAQIGALMKQSSALTELQVKLYCPRLFKKKGD